MLIWGQITPLLLCTLSIWTSHRPAQKKQELAERWLHPSPCSVNHQSKSMWKRFCSHQFSRTRFVLSWRGGNRADRWHSSSFQILLSSQYFKRCPFIRCKEPNDKWRNDEQSVVLDETIKLSSNICTNIWELDDICPCVGWGLLLKLYPAR